MVDVDEGGDVSAEDSIADRYEDAIEWYQSATEAEIGKCLVMSEWQRVRQDWTRLAVIALDQAGMLGARGRL